MVGSVQYLWLEPVSFCFHTKQPKLHKYVPERIHFQVQVSWRTWERHGKIRLTHHECPQKKRCKGSRSVLTASFGHRCQEIVSGGLEFPLVNLWGMVLMCLYSRGTCQVQGEFGEITTGQPGRNNVENNLCSRSASAGYCGNPKPQESKFSRKGQWALSKHGNLPERQRQRRICSHVPPTG